MGRVYNVFAGAAFNPAANDYVFRVLAAAEREFLVKRIWMTSLDTAGATVTEVVISRCTSVGAAGTACTQTPMNQNDAAGAFDADYNIGASAPGGLVGAWRGHWNPQVPFDLVFGPGDELVIPGATDEGFCIQVTTDPSTGLLVGATLEER